MSNLILPDVCKKSNLSYTRIALNSRDRATGDAQKGTIKLGRTWAPVVSILPRKAVVPIVSGGAVPVARLRLKVDNVDLNNVFSPTGEFALSVQIALDYSLQGFMKEEWPMGTEPLLEQSQVNESGMSLGNIWEYEWVQADGSPYTPAADWDLELTMVSMCCRPKTFVPCKN